MNNSGGSGRVLSTFLKILVWLCAVITFSVLIFWSYLYLQRVSAI